MYLLNTNTTTCDQSKKSRPSGKNVKCRRGPCSSSVRKKYVEATHQEVRAWMSVIALRKNLDRKSHNAVSESRQAKKQWLEDTGATLNLHPSEVDRAIREVLLRSEFKRDFMWDMAKNFEVMAHVHHWKWALVLDLIIQKCGWAPERHGRTKGVAAESHSAATEGGRFCNRRNKREMGRVRDKLGERSKSRATAGKVEDSTASNEGHHRTLRFHAFKVGSRC
jgi:hypothetical protein